MTTLRPVWNGYLADPMVFRARGRYYAIGTGDPDQKLIRDTGRAFPMLVSDDLQTWGFLGGALIPPAEPQGLAYWAPEVAEMDGRFFLYYSSGGEEGEGHKVRVAVSDTPEGPYEDIDRVLLPDEPFTIDASPFFDPLSKCWYLFFCRDYLNDPVGTGIAGAQLADDLAGLAAPPVTLLRAHTSWHMFERNRFWYGQTWPEWYTVEGPFVVYRQGRYYMFYSGGCWKNRDYGVGYGVADSPLGPYRTPHDDDKPSVLVSGHAGLIGPGHNSIVVGPDGQDYIVFHAWDRAGGARQMHIAPLDWSSGYPRVR